MSRTRSLQAAAATDPGRERANNEDRVLCEPDLGIFAVIDGVGGESAGEVAAEAALEVLRARLSRRTTSSARLVREAIALANRQIYERASADPKLAGMACVLTVAVLDGNHATVGHVGDSRLYALAPGAIRKATPDHSPVGAREDAGELSEIEAMRHPRRNEIYRDVGSGPHEPDDASWIDVLEVPFGPETALLLCSDGLSDMVPSRDILEAVEANAASPIAAVRALIDRANGAGGKDNISAVLVEGDRFAEAVRRRRATGPRAAAAISAPPAAPAAAAGGRTAGSARRSGAAATGTMWEGGGPAAKPRVGAAGAASVGQGARGARDAGGPPRGFRAAALWLLLAAAVATAAFAFRAPLLAWARRWVPGGAGSGSAVLVVGSGPGEIATIGEALARAHPGQTIEVAPGDYRERIVLRDGVSLVSREPRGARLLPPTSPTLPASPASLPGGNPGTGGADPGAGGAPPAAANDPDRAGAAPPAAGGPAADQGGPAAGPGDAGGQSGAAGSEAVSGAGGGGDAAGGAAALTSAVSASGIHGARLAGFRVGGGAAGGWQVGVLLDGSEVTLEEVEIAGAATAGIEIRGGDRSTVRHCYVHHNGGPGVVVADSAAPRLLDNLIAANGALIAANGLRQGAAAPGVEVRGTAKPLLAGNHVEGNGGPGVTLPALERVDEVFRWNSFGGLPREQAVRAVPAAGGGGGGAGGAAGTPGAGGQRGSSVPGARGASPSSPPGAAASRRGGGRAR